MQFSIVTLFPDIFDVLEYGVVGRALERELLTLSRFNPRDYSIDKHRHVDDRPYGGGPGMVMLAEPLAAAITAAKQAMRPQTKVVYLSPQGKPVTQAMAREAHKQASLILVCGRYEGIDERIVSEYVDEEWSIGDYVLSGGEFAALVVIDVISRLIPGVLGHADSAAEDSFAAGLLDCPHYTRPEVFQGQSVPSVLLSGNHAEIARWRMQQSLSRTWQRRPDLLEKLQLTAEQQQLLDEFVRGKSE
jgi:tRNA (guanine37-N1)-methyltransferase